LKCEHRKLAETKEDEGETDQVHRGKATVEENLAGEQLELKAESTMQGCQQEGAEVRDR
jgi:hypothetical protein